MEQIGMDNILFFTLIAVCVFQGGFYLGQIYERLRYRNERTKRTDTVGNLEDRHSEQSHTD